MFIHPCIFEKEFALCSISNDYYFSLHGYFVVISIKTFVNIKYSNKKLFYVKKICALRTPI